MAHRWIMLAPTPWYAGDAPPEQLTLAEGIRFGEIPEIPQAALDVLSRNQRVRLEECRTGFVCEYAADALGTPHPKYGPRLSIQDRVEEMTDWAALACWLIRPANVAVDVYVHLEYLDDQPVMRHSKGRPWRVMPMEGEGDDLLSSADERDLRALHEALGVLEREGTVWTGVTTLFAALGFRDWSVRFLMSWIALEALFGPRGPGGTSFRIAQRVALFLEDEPKAARARFAAAKEGYRWRSRVVHGMRLDKLQSKQSLALSSSTEEIARNALVKILSSPAHMSTFDGADRDACLDGLPFDLLGP